MLRFPGPTADSCGSCQSPALVIDWYIELRPAARTFDGFIFALCGQDNKRLLLAGQIADGARKRFVRPQSMPPIDESLNLDRGCVVRLEVIEKDVK